jgi:2-polyprenyl-3-methyl-5-hydroxy-6-metoxy-1,4-benzoquinol methylase
MTETILPSRRSRIAALAYDYAAKPKTHHALCNLCRHDVFVTIVHRDRYGYPARAQACRRCGLTFLNPVMTAESYHEFYTSIYRPLVSAYHGRLIDAASIQDEQHDYAAILAELLGRHLRDRRGGRLLDIGGSTGVVARHFKQAFGMRATVIDPAPMEVEVARRLELETVTGFVETYDPGMSRYHLVLMCQTVDHLLDISMALHKVRELMTDDGIFFIDIVDFRAAYRRNGSVEEAVKIDHPYYLTEATMEAFLSRAGLAVRAVDYARDHLHVGFVCSKGEGAPWASPSAEDVRDFFREIRAVHNPVPPPSVS